MKIQLAEWRVLETSLASLDDQERKDNSFELQTGVLYSEEDEKSFIISFEIKILDLKFDLFIRSIFKFNIDESITEEFKLSSFPKVNAPAIAFPYLRAYISNFTLQSGYKPVILPSINFVKFTESKDDQE